MKRLILIFAISGFIGISGANTPCANCDTDTIVPSLYDTLIPQDTLEAIKDRAIHKAIAKQLRTVDSLRTLRDSLTQEYRHLLREMKKKNSWAARMNGKQQMVRPYAQYGTITSIPTEQ